MTVYVYYIHCRSGTKESNFSARTASRAARWSGHLLKEKLVRNYSWCDSQSFVGSKSNEGWRFDDRLTDKRRSKTVFQEKALRIFQKGTVRAAAARGDCACSLR